MIINIIHADQLSGAWKLIAGIPACESNIIRLAAGEPGKGSESNFIKVLVNTLQIYCFNQSYANYSSPFSRSPFLLFYGFSSESQSTTLPSATYQIYPLT